MLQAQFRDAYGQEIALLSEYDGGELAGFWSAVKSVGSAIGSGASAAAGGVVDAANAMGGGIAQIGKSIPAAAKGIASTACGVVNSSLAQQGASMASQIPSGYTQGAAAGIAVGSSLCNMANPPKVPQQPTQFTAKSFLLQAKPAMTTMTAKPMATKPAAAAAAQFPAGSIQWRSSKDGLWHYAVPKAVAKSMGLGATPDVGLLGLGAGFISPWMKPSKFTSPWAVPSLRARYQRQYNWFDVNTADAPYRATWGMGESHAEVGAGAEKAPGVPEVTEKAGKKATTPFYKTWWFWAAVGGGTLVLGGTATYFIRKRKG
jgi:hypothetical protein